MTVNAIKPGWVKPETILFASEMPVNETAFESALAQAREFKAELVLFHAYSTLRATFTESSGICHYDYEGTECLEKQQLEPLTKRSRQAGVESKVVVRSGHLDEQILIFARERGIDRIVMSMHSPGPMGKFPAGSVAESVLRHSVAPVYIVGPQVALPEPGVFATHTVLCAVNMHKSSEVVVRFAAELAAQYEARLVLQHVIQPWKYAQALTGSWLDELETKLLGLVPLESREKVQVEVILVPGDLTEELLYHSQVQQADLIVLGAHEGAASAGATHHDLACEVIAQAHCPVITLSPVVLAERCADYSVRSTFDVECSFSHSS